MTQYGAILFDMDGVVIDSEPLHERAQRVIFRRHGLEVPAAALAACKGLVEHEVFTRIVRDFAPTPLDVKMLIDQKNAAYRELVDELELVPDVQDFIRRAGARYRLGLTTSSIRTDQALAFGKFDLDAFFDVIVTADDITRPKPDPEPYRITAERLGVAPEDCLVIEDSLNGVRSGRAAGCTVVGLTTSFDAPSLTAAGAQLTVDGFAELAAHLDLSLAA